MRPAAAVLAALLALPALARAEGAADADPDELLRRAIEAYRNDTAPPALPGVPEGRDEPDERLQRLRGIVARIEFVQAGHAAGVNSAPHEEAFGDGARYLERTIRVPLPAAYRMRTLPQLTHLRDLVARACAAPLKSADCSSAPRSAPLWCSIRKDVGPVLDQLLSRPEGPVRLPAGHPYSLQGVDTLSCGAEEDPKRALERRRSEVTERLQRAFESDDPSTALGQLKDVYGDIGRLADQLEREACGAGLARGGECGEARRLKTMAANMIRAIDATRRCLDDPDSCGDEVEQAAGVLCGMYSACSLPRAAAAYARDPGEETEAALYYELGMLATAALGPLQPFVKLPANFAARWATRSRAGGALRRAADKLKRHNLACLWKGSKVTGCHSGDAFDAWARKETRRLKVDAEIPHAVLDGVSFAVFRTCQDNSPCDKPQHFHCAFKTIYRKPVTDAQFARWGAWAAQGPRGGNALVPLSALRGARRRPGAGGDSVYFNVSRDPGGLATGYPAGRSADLMKHCKP